MTFKFSSLHLFQFPTPDFSVAICRLPAHPIVIASNNGTAMTLLQPILRPRGFLRVFIAMELFLQNGWNKKVARTGAFRFLKITSFKH
jgi:hypothetical protein